MSNEDMTVKFAEDHKFMNDVPLVSAVIPTRNRPEVVRRAVHSALNQTYPNVEVIVVVDGPDPATVERLEALNERRLRVVALPENVGGSEARNRGIYEANGEYVALLDDDDEWLPEKIERQVLAFRQLNTPIAIVTSKHILKHQGQPDRILPPRLPQENENISDYMFYAKYFRRPAYGPQTSTFFARKDFFTAVPFKKGLKCHQDWQWFLAATAQPGATHLLIEEPLCLVHESVKAPSVTKTTQWKDSLEWLESASSMFSPRAYSSFMVRQCMYRCAETTNRLGVFLNLLKRCVSRGYLDLSMILIAIRWYFYSPHLRQRAIQSNS
jgi:glycosyltransferase involved in cell wall biosynthesis